MKLELRVKQLNTRSRLARSGAQPRPRSLRMPTSRGPFSEQSYDVRPAANFCQHERGLTVVVLFCVELGRTLIDHAPKHPALRHVGSDTGLRPGVHDLRRCAKECSPCSVSPSGVAAERLTKCSEHFTADGSSARMRLMASVSFARTASNIGIRSPLPDIQRQMGMPDKIADARFLLLAAVRSRHSAHRRAHACRFLLPGRFFWRRGRIEIDFLVIVLDCFSGPADAFCYLDIAGLGCLLPVLRVQFCLPHPGIMLCSCSWGEDRWPRSRSVDERGP